MQQPHGWRAKVNRRIVHLTTIEKGDIFKKKDTQINLKQLQKCPVIFNIHTEQSGEQTALLHRKIHVGSGKFPRFPLSFHQIIPSGTVVSSQRNRQWVQPPQKPHMSGILQKPGPSAFLPPQCPTIPCSYSPAISTAQLPWPAAALGSFIKGHVPQQGGILCQS